MSAECTGWVYRHSPAKGATLLVHLAAADSANDQHGYELWMRQHWLAAKARVSRRAVTEALAWLCEHGLLQLLESGAAKGSANRYRFLMPELPALWDPQGVHQLRTPPAPAASQGAQTVLGGAGSPCSHNPSANPTTEPNQQPRADAAALAAGFDRFWHAYPRATAKGDARKAWPAAVRAAGGIEAIVAGAERYAADPNRDDRFTKHPATWLRAECWADPPLPPRAAGPNPAKVRAIDTNREAAGGRLEL